MGRFSLTYLDHSKERSAFSVPIDDITDVNYAVQIAAADALRDAINNVTLGTLVKDERVASVVQNPATIPADPNAQRETKWAIRATDDVNGKAVFYTLPTADLATQIPGQGIMDPGDALYTALVAAIEGFVKSSNGNDITVVEIVHVGRTT